MPIPSSHELTLAAAFPPASREQWRTLAAAVLKGASFDDTLVSETYDGLRIEPLYERSRKARPLAARARLAGAAAGRSSRAGRRQCAGAARFGEWRERPAADFFRPGGRPRLRP